MRYPAFKMELVPVVFSSFPENLCWTRKYTLFMTARESYLDEGIPKLPYYMKFSRHVYFAILMCAAHFAILRTFYFESLQFRVFE